MDTPEIRLVAVCDILGFSSFIEKQPLTQVVANHIPRLLNVLENTVTQQYPTGESISIKHLAKSDELGVAWFSDTILYYALDDSDESCKKLIEAAGWLLFRTHFQLPELRIRIGISYGELYVNEQKDLFLGKSIVEAHKIEKQQLWMGGALSKGAEARMRSILPDLAAFPPFWWLTQYPVPTKAGSDSDLLGSLAVDWTQGSHTFDDMLWSPKSNEPSPSEWQDHPDICIKWQNTRTFHRTVCSWCRPHYSSIADE